MMCGRLSALENGPGDALVRAHLHAVTPATGQAAACTSSRCAGVRMTWSRATMTYVEKVPMGGLAPPPRRPNLLAQWMDRTFVCDGVQKGRLRSFGSERIVLPSAGRDEKDALVQ
jgi:hypothetical protein